jgi:DNA integrity scanning protein DisA with diadenylate cyclase activity
MCPNPAREALRAELLAAMVPLGAREHEGAVLAEAEYALRPHVHEGKVVAYGFAHVDRLLVPEGATLIRHDQMPLRVARILADGSASFVCLEGGEYGGLLVLGTPCEDEYDLVRLRTALGGLVGLTDASGASRFFSAGGIAVHEYRRWRFKPTVKESASAIRRHAPELDAAKIESILAFCYHGLSPTGTGTILVWYVRAPSEGALGRASVRVPLAYLELNVFSQSSLRVLHSLLNRSDGAVLVEPDGRVLGLGAHLQVSESSQTLIAPSPGTRHTSARRYSYDWPEAVAFTVSVDGPVTVYSDGCKVTELALIRTDQVAAVLRRIAPGRDDLAAEEWEAACPRCHKVSLVGGVRIPGWHERQSAICAVCGAVVAEEATLQLSARVVKRLPDRPRAA